LELEFMNLLGEVMYLALPLPLLACATAVIFRFRRSRGDEREQLKWVVYAVSLIGFLFVFWFSLVLARNVTADALLFTVPLAGLPLAVGIAILKYRLYDIDLVINRTLVYGTLTAALAVVYLGCVVVLRGLLFGFTGQSSQLTIVASTLAVAALFGPLRRRIQEVIDRRFYRKKYDAAKTLEAFGARLRDQTELGELSDDLLGVVRESMHPEHVALWLRTPSGAGLSRGREGA